MAGSWKIWMGALPEATGCTFRVWAPNAQAVFVVGSFNGFSEEANPMKRTKADVWSVTIPGVKPGDAYRYRIVTENGAFLRMDPYSRAASHSDGHSIVPQLAFSWGEGEFNAPAPHEMVIYEMHIGTFAKNPGEEVGTIDDAIAKLGYLKDLGITVIEIMPVMEFAGSHSWGYNPALIYAVESDYGEERDLRRFIRSAHEQGIAVWLDVVYNHLGPQDLDLWQFDGWQENDKGGIYFYNDDRSRTPWGDTRPDYGRPEVRAFLRDNALYWLQDYHFDGLRWDATAYIRNVDGRDGDAAGDLPDGWSLMQWINEEARKVKPGTVTIAEDLRSNPAITRPAEAGGAGFDAQWDGAFVHPVRQALIGAEDAARDMEAIRNALLHRFDDNAFARVIYTESHDEVANGKARVPEEVDPGNASSWAAKKKSVLGASLVFTAPGIPMIFQGQEFLEDDWFHDKDPLDWSKKDRYAGIVRVYRDLIALRLNRRGQTAGLCGQQIDVYHTDQQNKVLAYHRWQEGGRGDSVVVVVNFSTQLYENYAVDFPAEGEWKVRFNGDSGYYDPEFNNGGVCCCDALRQEDNAIRGSLIIPPYTALLLSQDKP